ncbi:hypothetical protein N2152v2_005738 [Parachlorella kessleri]
MSSYGCSTAALLSLLRLAAQAASAAAAAEFQAALARMMLWGPSGAAKPGIAKQESSGGQTSLRQHMKAVASLMQACSEGDMKQLAANLQSFCSGSGGRSRAAAAQRAALVQGCYAQVCPTLQQLQQQSPAVLPAALCENNGQPGESEGAASQAQLLETISNTLRVLYVLGALSTSDHPAAVAEAAILLQLVRILLQAPQLINLQASQPGPHTTAQQPQKSPAQASPSQPMAATAGTFAQLDVQQSLQQALLWACSCLAKALQQLAGRQLTPAGKEDEAVATLYSGIPPVLAALMVSTVTQATRAAGLEVLRSLPDPQGASQRLMRHLSSSISGITNTPAALASSLPCQLPGLACSDDLHGEHGLAGFQLRHRSSESSKTMAAMLSLLHLLEDEADGYQQDKARLKEQLRGDGQGNVPAGGPCGGSVAAEGAGNSGDKEGEAFDYMQAEDEAHKQEAAAQRFLEELLATRDTAPACYLPLLQRLLLEGSGVPPDVQAGALRCMGRMLVLSQALCADYLPALESCLASSASLAVKAAAVEVLAAVIDAFPSTLSGKLGLIGQLVVQQGISIELQQRAAAAFARLLLQNKFKLQGMLAVVGQGLTSGGDKVARILRHSLGQLLRTAGPKERARIALDLFHQTPLGLREAVVQELACNLLAEADLRNDLLVGQAAQAFFAAAASGDGGTAAATALLLARLKPSARVLSACKTQLEGWGSNGSLAPHVAAKLKEFVSNHVASCSPTAEDTDGIPGAPEPAGAGPKRKRAAAATNKKQGVGAERLRQEVLGLLGRLETAGGRRKAA